MKYVKHIFSPFNFSLFSPPFFFFFFFSKSFISTPYLSTQTKRLLHHSPLQLLPVKWQDPTEVQLQIFTQIQTPSCSYDHQCFTLQPQKMCFGTLSLKSRITFKVLAQRQQHPCEFSPTCPPAPWTFHTARKTDTQCLLKTVERCLWIDFILT